MTFPVLVVVLSIAVFLILGFNTYVGRNKRYFGQTVDEPAASDAAVEGAPSDDNDTLKKPTPMRRVFLICFHMVFIVFWTSALLRVSKHLRALSFGDDGFLVTLIWMVGAIAGWFYVVWTLFRLLRGDDVKVHFKRLW